MLDRDHCKSHKGEVRIAHTHTRDVQFLPETRFPLHELPELSPDALWVGHLFTYDVDLVSWW